MITCQNWTLRKSLSDQDYDVLLGASLSISVPTKESVKNSQNASYFPLFPFIIVKAIFRPVPRSADL